MTREASFWIKQIESLPKKKCPRCKTENVLSHKTSGRNWFSRRKCQHCGHQWTGFSSWYEIWLSPKAVTWPVLGFAVLLAGVLYLVYYLLNLPPVPLEPIKQTLLRLFPSRTTG